MIDGRPNQPMANEIPSPSPPERRPGPPGGKIAVFSPVLNSVKGGGEKLLLEIRDHFRADLVVGSIDLKFWGRERAGHDSFVSLLWREGLGLHFLSHESRIPGWRRFKRKAVFRHARRVRMLDGYGLVIFYDDPAHVPGRVRAARKVLYCNTPPRHLADRRADFLGKFPRWLRPLMDLVLRRDLKRYIRDIRRMDLVITNSHNVRRRLLQLTGIDSQVVFPPVLLDGLSFLGQEGYYLSYARLEEWKRIRLIVAAFRKMPGKRLVVASSGPLRKWLEGEIRGQENILYAGQVTDEQLRHWIGNCVAGIYIPINEDAGMTPCELMTAGKPVIGVGEGGLLETVIDGRTGTLIPPDPQVADLVAAVNWLSPDQALRMKEDCLLQGRRFDKGTFFGKIEAALAPLGFPAPAAASR